MVDMDDPDADMNDMIEQEDEGIDSWPDQLLMDPCGPPEDFWFEAVEGNRGIEPKRIPAGDAVPHAAVCASEVVMNSVDDANDITIIKKMRHNVYRNIVFIQLIQAAPCTEFTSNRISDFIS